LFSIEFQIIDSRIYLLVSGYDGILMYDWRDILAQHQTFILKDERKPTRIISVNPVRKFSPYPSPRCGLAEVNTFSVDNRNKLLYGACGDMYGCYQWDLETRTLLTTLKGGHDNYLHSVKVVQDGSSVVLTGGEDGKMGVWSGKSGGCELIDVINISEKLKIKQQIQSKKKNHAWISGIDIHNNNTNTDARWASICGGVESNHQKSHSGYLMLYNLPTRTISSSVLTRECPQYVLHDDINDRTVTVGNESVLSYWSAFDNKKRDRVWCSTPSGYCVAINKHNGLTAVGGVGCKVDGFSDFGRKEMTWNFC